MAKSEVGWDHSAEENIDMNSLRINSLGDPQQDNDAANKEYVDDHTDGDSNPNNEIQSITKSGNVIELSDGGGMVIDDNTTYSGSDFAISNQTCPAGQIIKSINADGTILCGIDETNDADNDPTNEIETWSTLSGIPTGFSDDIDDVDDADNDPTNEIETWSTLSGIPTGFSDDVDDVDDADNDPTNEIETWSTLAGIPSGFSDDTDDVDDADNDPTNEIETWSTLAGIPSDFSDDVDDVDDADNDPTNEIETWSTLAGIPAGFTDGIDDVNDADNDPTNEIETWSTLAGIPAGFTDEIDDVDDADSDPTNEIETWSTLSGIPGAFSDGIDDVNDADNDPTNEIETWSTLAGIPAGFTDEIDDVDDADSDPTNEIETWSTLSGIPGAFSDGIDDVNDADASATNEKITSIVLSGNNELSVKENGISYSTDLSGLDNGWVKDGSDNLNYEDGNITLGTVDLNRSQEIFGGIRLTKNSGTLTPHINLVESSGSDGARITFTSDVEIDNRWTLWGKVNDGMDSDNVFNIYSNAYGNVASFTGEGYMGIRDSSPEAALDINGPTDGDAFRVRRYGNVEMQIKSNGAISIGSENANVPANVTYIDNKLGVDIDDPNYTLVAQGRLSASWDQTQVDRLDFGHGGSNAYINSAGAGNLDFRHDDSNLMTLVDNGHLLLDGASDNASRLINTGSGAYLTIGGTWTNSSSRELKNNFQRVNSNSILTKLASLNILTWNYKGSDEGLHIGPIAEEFHDAFGFGNSDGKSISTVDADGIALAAIQALKKENDELKIENIEIKKRLDRLEVLMMKMVKDEH